MLHRLASRWTQRAALVSVLTLAMTLFNGATVNAAATAATTTPTTVTVWIQTMDSCQQAIPGASFSVKGNYITYKAGPAPGTKPVTVASAGGNCPLQRGNCATVPTGCVSFVLPVPTGTSKVSYTGKQTVTPSGYVPCTGGSACRSETIKFTISPTGVVSGKVTNVYPDGTSVTWPSSGTYTATQTDPIVVHNFGLGTGSCDGDADADDHLTGSASTHCDSESD